MERETERAVRADIIRLLVLLGCTVGLFFFTRSVAVRQRQSEIRDAAQWYATGNSQLRLGQLGSAIESLRKATQNDRGNGEYLLRLADALGKDGRNAEALQALSRLRESDPEDAEVNLHLAMLTAKEGDVINAMHYYENALYGRWSGGQVDERQRQTRIDLIRFLLDHQDRDRALSELFILDNELPDTAAAHNQAAEMFLRAGDSSRALKDFARATQLDPGNVEALAGTGMELFQTRNYPRAYNYLKAAIKHGEQSQQVAKTLSLVQLVLSNDPLARGISKSERKRRTLVAFDQSTQRLEQCLEQPNGNSNLYSLKTQASALEPKLHSKAVLHSNELTKTALGLVYQIEKATDTSCGNAAPTDQALLLMARQYETGGE